MSPSESGNREPVVQWRTRRGSLCRLSLLALLGGLLLAWVHGRVRDPQIDIACLARRVEAERVIARVAVDCEMNPRWQYSCPVVEYMDAQGRVFADLATPIRIYGGPPLIHQKRDNGWLLNVSLPRNARSFRVTVAYYEDHRNVFADLVASIARMLPGGSLPGAVRGVLPQRGAGFDTVTSLWVSREDVLKAEDLPRDPTEHRTSNAQP